MEGQLKKIHGQNNHFHMMHCTTRHPMNYEKRFSVYYILFIMLP